MILQAESTPNWPNRCMRQSHRGLDLEERVVLYGEVERIVVGLWCGRGQDEVVRALGHAKARGFGSGGRVGTALGSHVELLEAEGVDIRELLPTTSRTN